MGLSVNFLADNEVKLLHTGTDYFPALIAAIDNARVEVYFETYIFAPDETGQRVLAALIAAAQRGIHVRMITDWWGTGRRQVNSMHEQLVAGGVEHRVFNPWFKRGVTRTHRKICVVDREIALVGGININDDMFCDYNHAIPLEFPRWDFAVQVRGPLVASVQKEQEAQWRRLGKMTLIKRINLYRDMRKVNQAAAKNMVQAGFVVRDNLRNRSTIQRAYLQALGRARKSVLLANPYFAPGRKFRHALANAAERGVDVTLLIGVGEIWLQDAVAHSFYPKLLAAGVKIVEYRKTQLHAKVAVIDDDWATVGSSNVDGLSLFLNQEANVVIKDAAFAQSLREHIEAAVADGVPIHYADFEHVGRFRRIGYEIAFVFYRTVMRLFSVGKYA
ncbi:cardiolipin synthase [Duganella sp. 3397]|uniref:Cardiolipin synthase B n=1 Tax=Duganella phyllosphaerae TaxID=762836 RepID=A0A1E7WGA5_9BURK|nr:MULTISPECIES: cardiolipin synthase ClsB [Duganella]MDR7048313.1 cardiolipin synthase [Duganella sp. 3397]OEZ97505.1 putative cardiolipin synthase YbhO [Duganella phyllosphaerae]